ncbi:MAG: M56 family metallopeptidase [Planctomycetota bacterium]|nr:M56 family metallopeptidase [Planctomycetota bacterium]
MAAVLEQSAQGLSFLLDAAVKATVLLAAAGLLALLLRRQSAAMRHLVWLVAIGGIVLMPVLMLVLPGLSVPLGASFSPQVAGAGKAEVFTARPTQAAERKSPQPRPPDPAAVAAALQKPLPAAETPVVAPAAILDDAEPPLPWSAWVLIAWFAGAAAVAAYLAVGTVGVWAIVRRARPVEGGPWGKLMEGLCRELGLARPVRLAVSEQAIIPVAWGLARPVVLVPRAAEKWPEDRRRVVLLHELAHVKRRDCLTQTLALAACVLYWFNPLAWLAARRLRIEREGACDDLVLAAGSPAADYAGHLLEIVRALRPAARTPLAAVAMARQSHFESRLRAILDVARNRRAIGRRAALLVVVLGGCLLLPLAACQPQAPETDKVLFGNGAASESPSEAQELIALIQRTVSSQSDSEVAAWSDEGGSAVVECYNGVLIVSQSPAGHRRLAGLLDILQRTGAIKADAKEKISKEPESEGATRVRGLLAQKIDVNFEKIPLRDVLAIFADVAKPGLNIVVDYPNVESSFIDPSTSVVGLKAKQKSVEWLLDQVLPSELGWKVGPGYVLVTSRDILHQDLPLGMYKVWGRDGKPLGAGHGVHLLDLVDVLQKNVGSQQQPGVAGWSDEGGPADVEYFNGVLLVTQTRKGHERVASFLTRLAEKGAISAQSGKGIEMNAESAEAAKVRRLLDEPVDVAFEKAPLSDVLAYLGQAKPGLAVRIDQEITEVLAGAVTLKVKQVSIGAVLDLVLGNDLAYKVDADGVLVMHRDKAMQNLVTVAYKVGL